MDNTTFRTAPQPKPVSTEPGPDFVKNEVGTSVEPEPVSGETMPQVILDVLGIDNNVKDLPSDEVMSLQDIASYLEDQLRSSGKMPSVATMGRKLDEIKEELGMDDQTESQVVLDRLGGLVKAWRNIGFIKDPASKRSLFMKLARCKDSKEMHKLVFAEETRRDVFL